MPSSRGSFRFRDQTHISYVSCIGRWVLYHQCHLGSHMQRCIPWLPVHRSWITCKSCVLLWDTFWKASDPPQLMQEYLQERLVLKRVRSNVNRAQGKSLVAERTGSTVGAEVRLQGPQTDCTFILPLASLWYSHQNLGLNFYSVFIPVYLTTLIFIHFKEWGNKIMDEDVTSVSFLIWYHCHSQTLSLDLSLSLFFFFLLLFAFIFCGIYYLAISFCFFSFFWDIFFFCATPSSGLGTNNLFFFSKDHLNVAGRAHVGVDPTVSSVSPAPHLGGFVHLDVLNDQRIYI